MSKRFRVALSFPGDRRQFVAEVAKHLATKVGRAHVLYDGYYEAEFARLDLDHYLQRLYHDESELIAVFLCDDYERKEWCGLEWRTIRDVVKRRLASDVMPLRFDETHIPGLFSIDGYVWINGRQPEEIADLIMKRLHSKGQRGEWHLIIRGRLEELDPSFLGDIVGHLRRQSGDVSIELTRIKSGSVIFVLEGTKDGFDRLEALFQEGVLASRLMVTIEGLEWHGVATPDPMTVDADLIAGIAAAAAGALPSKVAQLREVNAMKPNAEIPPQRLIELVRQKQRENVRESWGTAAHESFTDADLSTFKRKNKHGKIAKELGKASSFKELIVSIRALDAGSREELFDEASEPLRPTWSEIGEISRRGQTEAGQEAERLIGEAIVAMVRVRLSTA